MRVDRLRSVYAIEIAYTHYPLHPDTPDQGLTLEQLFAGRGIDIAASKAHMAELMATAGLAYGERTMTFNSRRAQELAKWAETQPGGDAIHLALFQTYFARGQNIAETDVLLAAVEQIGLPLDEARDVLQHRAFQAAADADWQRSRQLGITGVPTFVVGRHAIVGAQPYEALEELVVRAGARARI